MKLAHSLDSGVAIACAGKRGSALRYKYNRQDAISAHMAYGFMVLTPEDALAGRRFVKIFVLMPTEQDELTPLERSRFGHWLADILPTKVKDPARDLILL